MARTRGATAITADQAINKTAKPTDAKNNKTRPFAPAKKMHRAPRLTRKPLSTLDTNTRSAKKQSAPDEKPTKKRTPPKITRQSTKDASSDVSLSPPPTIPTQPMHASQHVAESICSSSAIPAPTPSVAEHSILALKNFRRRPRQPSMLNMVKQRLASARSSLVIPDPPDFGSDDSLDLDDFMPDAAGTPMHSSGADVVAIPVDDDLRSSSNKRKRARNDTEPNDCMDSVDRSLLKYRKLVSQSSDESEIIDELPIDASQASRIRSTPERVDDNHETTLNITELAAATSPVSASSALSPQQHATQNSDVYAPPMSQLTPPRNTRTATKPVVAPSSAILQSLLPKRRKRFDTNRPVPTLRLSDTQDDGQYDLPSSPASGDVDDSEYAQAGHKKATGSKAARGSRAESRRGLRPKQPNAARNERNEKAATRSRTYGRKKANDKSDQNNDMHNDNSDPDTTLEEAFNNKELQAARKKFQEIDKWEMEFETLTNEESRSSSQNWR